MSLPATSGVRESQDYNESGGAVKKPNPARRDCPGAGDVSAYNRAPSKTLVRTARMRAKARAQPNIALIKYWGKRDVERNLPAVGSLSITLDSLWTTMDVEFAPDESCDSLGVNGRPEMRMLPRVSACLDRIAGSDRPRARVTSECNFPIAAGLASSASSFAALAVAASAACGQDLDALALARAAGAASGSAARSLFGGFVELEPGDDDIDLDVLRPAADWPLRVVVAVTATGPKPLSSGQAMQRSAGTSPFYRRWIDQQPADLAAARAAVESRDFAALADVSEHNCLKMHSVMWTARPPVVYWNNTTLECMSVVTALRDRGESVFFTIDAGPQVKAVCLPGSERNVVEALAAIGGVEAVMTSGLGDGARLLGG